MKAFEKWWKAYKEAHAYKLVKQGVISPSAMMMEYAMQAIEPEKHRYKEAWKAALKWIYNEPKGLPNDWKALIEEELKNE